MKELFEYTIANNQAIVKKYLGGDSLTAVEIPAEFEGCPVTEIGDEAFEDTRYSNSLVDIECGHNPREYSIIETITIPDTVRIIGESAFSGLARLKRIKLPSSLEIIGDGAFEWWHDCKKIYIPNGVKKIGDYAFGNPLFSDVYLPPSAVEIEEYAFGECAGCGPSEHKIRLHLSPDAPPEQLKGFPWRYGYNLGFYCFKVLFDYGKPDDKDRPPSDVLTREQACKMKGFEIPSGCTEIGEEAFRGRNDITGIIIPHGVTYIEAGAFSFCEGLTEITIPESVFYIGGAAFEGCKNLSRVTILNKSAIFSPLHNYHAGTFKDCDKLTVYCPSDSFVYKFCQQQNLNVKEF